VVLVTWQNKKHCGTTIWNIKHIMTRTQNHIAFWQTMVPMLTGGAMNMNYAKRLEYDGIGITYFEVVLYGRKEFDAAANWNKNKTHFRPTWDTHCVSCHPSGRNTKATWQNVLNNNETCQWNCATCILDVGDSKICGNRKWGKASSACFTLIGN
jgi:hypothetical protein